MQKGLVEQDVFSRMLVVKNPKTHDIIRESGFYFFNTTRRRFTGDVLGYITPVSLLLFMVHICLLLMILYTYMLWYDILYGTLYGMFILINTVYFTYMHKSWNKTK